MYLTNKMLKEGDKLTYIRNKQTNGFRTDFSYEIVNIDDDCITVLDDNNEPGYYTLTPDSSGLCYSDFFNIRDYKLKQLLGD